MIKQAGIIACRSEALIALLCNLAEVDRDREKKVLLDHALELA